MKQKRKLADDLPVTETDTETRAHKMMLTWLLEASTDAAALHSLLQSKRATAVPVLTAEDFAGSAAVYCGSAATQLLVLRYPSLNC